VKPNCRRICDLLAQYADGTLPDEQRNEVQRHLDACPPCRTVSLKECGARMLLRACAPRLKSEHLQDTPVPPGLRTRCESLSAASHATRSWFGWLLPIAVTALLIALAGSLLSVVTPYSDTLLAAQLTADHVKCFGLFGPKDGQTLDAAQAQQMLAARFGLDVHVPPSTKGSTAADGVQLVNARRCLYAEGRVPHLMYEANGQDVSLFILEGQTRKQADVDAFGYHTRIWSRGGNTFVLVTPASGASAAAAARYVAAEAH
jgi:anti-sigma factor RsiW